MMRVTQGLDKNLGVEPLLNRVRSISNPIECAHSNSKNRFDVRVKES